MVQVRWAGCLLAVVILTSCRLSPVIIPSPPSHIEKIEGFASLRMKSEEKEVRSRFSFLFQLPKQGRLDFSNLLGKTLYQIVIYESKAFLLIPAKKIYWQGGEEEIID